MIEAVGWRDFGTFFARCSDLLADDGAMLLQAITMDDRAYEVEKALARASSAPTSSPNGCLPSLEVIARCVARRTDLRTVAPRGPHAPLRARRCGAGASNFERERERLAELGYDERFRRLWRLYLSYCEAGFAERRIGPVQIVLAKPALARPVAAAGRRRARSLIRADAG